MDELDTTDLLMLLIAHYAGRCKDEGVNDRVGCALVVGASSDIGCAIAVSLGRLGYTVVAWGRSASALSRTATAVADAGGRAVTAQVEITEPDVVLSAFDEIRQRRAELGPLRCVVYAAGVFDWAPASEADARTWQRVVEVNLTGATQLTALALPVLTESARSGGAALVYIGSSAAHRAYANNAAYVASKHGLAALAEAVFLDVRDAGIKVSLVSPGLVASGAGVSSPEGRAHPEMLLTPQDVATAVTFVVTFPARGCPTVLQVEPQVLRTDP